ncbi:efflux RND transporter periplasmic adaptor subunit [Novipirellula sp.]|uniref:efflux RND transporter periplasmic adaptor subunit n=1 Tax=Novipirellula sp. TaxID=2795430 RepID=UPI00356AC50D
MNEFQSPPKWRWFGVVGTLIACVAILSASAAAIVVINRTEPTAKQIKATRKSAALVEAMTVKRGTFSPTLRVLGTVQAAQEIVLSPRVSGQVVEVSPQFLPGGRVRKGDLLLRIDPADYENALSIQESELEQTEASLKIEEGRQSLAQKELRLLEGTIDDTNRELVLRAPQIASIRAEVNAAKAAVERAKLDLARSSVFAPFDAQVISRSVNVGSQVSPGDELARLVGIDEYWVSAALPVRSLRWVQFATSEQPGSNVTLLNPDAWPLGTQKQARVARMIGTVDERTRLAQVLVTVPDPLGETSDTPPLILQSLIEVQIEGRAMKDVVRLDRRYVREGDTVWVMQEGQLQIRDTEVLFRDAEYAYIGEGLQSGDEVVTTTLATVAEGVGLRKINEVASVIPGEAAAANSSRDEADDEISEDAAE